MTKQARFQFSLSTFMLVVLWSAVVLGIITQHRVQLWKLNVQKLWLRIMVGL